MAVTARTLGEALRAVVGPGRVVDEPSALARGAVDGRAPRVIVQPGSPEAVAGVLALAHEERLVVVPRGSGSTLELGHPLERVDVVLDLRALDAVLAYHPDDLTVTVQAGTTAGALAGRLAPRRQCLPVDPPGGAARTLGGLAATGASGPRRVRYGTLRDLVLGVRFAQADGTLTWGGARVVKSVSGYDVPRLLVGSLGTLGVLLELTLRLHPEPEHEATGLARFASAAAAGEFVAALSASTVQPTRVEIMNTAVLGACQVARSPVAVGVSLGSVEAAVREQADHVRALAAAAGGESEEAPAAFWADQDAALPADAVVLRVATPPASVGATVAALEQETVAAGVVPFVTGCAAVGALRLAHAALAPRAGAALVERLRARLGADGTTVTIERGPRELRAAVDPWPAVAPPALDLMRALREEFDPRRILNPGRFVGGL
jgi:glycolate oxidase FAD binding subunit